MSRTITNELFLNLGPYPREKLLESLRPHGGEEELTYGYLGENEQPEAIIEDDRRVMRELGITFEQMARTIEDMFLHMPRSIHTHRLLGWEFIHSPVCPWGDFCAVSPFDLTLKNTELWLCNSRHYLKLQAYLVVHRTAASRLLLLKHFVEWDWLMVFSDLHPHLLREHEFCQSHSTPYRVDPERFVRYLGRRNIYPYKT